MPLITKRSEIADLLTKAIAQATGLKPEQIEAVDADSTQIVVHYTGAQPGLSGGHGRKAIQTWDTETGNLISDELHDDPEELARTRANVDAARRSLFTQR